MRHWEIVRATICRELTKKFEAFTTTLEMHWNISVRRIQRGEYVIVLEGKSHQGKVQREQEENWEELSVEEHMEHYLLSGN